MKKDTSVITSQPVPGAAVIRLTLRVRGRGLTRGLSPLPQAGTPKKPGESHDCNNYRGLRGGNG